MRTARNLRLSIAALESDYSRRQLRLTPVPPRGSTRSTLRLPTDQYAGPLTGWPRSMAAAKAINPKTRRPFMDMNSQPNRLFATGLAASASYRVVVALLFADYWRRRDQLPVLCADPFARVAATPLVLAWRSEAIPVAKSRSHQQMAAV